MTDSVKEQLSACLDGELPERELDLLLKRLDQDPELRACMGRYGLISETLRAGKPASARIDLAGAVMTRIQAEPAPRRPAGLSPAVARRLRPVAGIAVAASVAALAIFSVQQTGLLSSTDDTGEQATIAMGSMSEETDRYVVPTMPSTSSAFIPATRLTNYVVAHSEYSSPLGRRSVLSGVLAEGEAELLNESVVEDAAGFSQDSLLDSQR